MMKSPSVTTPASGAIVAVATMLTAAVRTPLMIVGTASGSSTLRITSSSVIPTPRAASTAPGSTWRMATNVLVRIGGIPSTISAMVSVSTPKPTNAAMNAIRASSGIARPALPERDREQLAGAAMAEVDADRERDRQGDRRAPAR